MIDLLLIRSLFILVLACAGFFLQPFGVSGPVAALAGAVAGGCVVFFEIRIRQVSLKRLMGAAFGSILGILGAYLISLVLGRAIPGSDRTVPFLEIALLAWMTYCGLMIGAAKGDLLNLSALGGLFGGEVSTKTQFKILDTSVIIDGRIADVIVGDHPRIAAPETPNIVTVAAIPLGPAAMILHIEAARRVVVPPLPSEME